MDTTNDATLDELIGLRGATDQNLLDVLDAARADNHHRAVALLEAELHLRLRVGLMGDVVELSYGRVDEYRHAE